MAGFFNLDEIAEVPVKTPKKKQLEANCDTCGLYKTCLSPQMEPVGKNRLGILFVSEVTGKEEDRQGKQLVGQSGKFLRRIVRSLGLDLELDFLKTNSVICRPPNSAEPSPLQIMACRKKLMAVIEQYKPKAIIALGKIAMEGLIGHRIQGRLGDHPPGIAEWQGCRIPDQELKTWIIPSWHPQYILRMNEDPVLIMQLKQQILVAVDLAKKPFPIYDWEPRCHVVRDVKEAIKVIDHVRKVDSAFDYETTGLKPYREGHEIYTASVSDGDEAWAFPFFIDPVFRRDWKFYLKSPATIKDAHNRRFEALWTKVILGYWPLIQSDTILGVHCYHNKKPTGLKFQTYVRYGILGYDSEVDPYLETPKEEEDKYGANGFNNIRKAPLNKLLLYNGADSLFTKWISDDLKRDLTKKQREGKLFFDEASPKLVRMEFAGINMDGKKFEEVKIDLTKRMNRLEKRVKSMPELKLWDKPKPFRMSAPADLTHLLFDLMKYEAKEFTSGGKTGIPKPKSDKETLEKIDELVVKKVLEWRKWQKARDTYLADFIRETVDGILHPSFNLNTVDTFRSSSNDPNFQNIPKRQKDVMRMLRSLLKPYPGQRLVEDDYKAVEVAVGACYHKDPNMIKYIEDSSTDMHRDTQFDLFFRDLKWFKDPANEVLAKEERQIAKNGFVFPEFYGSYFEHTAPDIWDDISAETKEHLRKNGIRHLKDFTAHVEEVERVLWEDRFPVYAQWKKDYYAAYLKRGYIDTYTGFRCYGPMKKNQVVNYPIQGSAFHCLLWSILKVSNEMDKMGLISRYIGQIHDSGMLSVVPQEEAILDHLVWDWGTQKIREHWDWICVPLTIEKSVSAIDGDWSQMKDVGKLKSAS